MAEAESLICCVCSKPASNRCSACKTVSYCSPECQRKDWKKHKLNCRTTTAAALVPQVGTARQLNELLRIGAQYTIYQETTALGLDPSLITGATGADFYRENDDSENFWRLWMDYLSPITVDKVWIDVVLDAILHVRLPSNNHDPWQDQVNANILAGLYPHLHKFTARQNTTLLDIFASHFWCDETFRLSLGTDILFGHGKPTSNLVDQLIRRCLSWTRRYSELDQLLSCVALPIQKHWPEIAGTRIVDLALVMLSPGRPGPAGGRTVPGDKILEIAQTSPAACKHLLPVIMRMCRANMITGAGAKLNDFLTSFGIQLQRSEMLPWLMMEFMGDEYNTKKLQQLLADEMDGKLAVFGIEARDYSLADLREMNAAAMARLGNLEGE
ncbi:hypothetical protein C8J57DRAFT_1333198 [Mycena rebaudengoi]|nr:hypothetical protein C8J57DRAFT_1333198 [Mycena rebaudengoi]